VSAVKLCKDCKFFGRDEYGRTYCIGAPHLYPDVVDGEAVMELPGARYSGGDGLRRDIQPCGETEARHWTPKAQPARRRWFAWMVLS
jgi:hypothetical protein